MKEMHKASLEKRRKKIKEIKRVLQQKEEVVFAYVFGSFLKDPVFRDIDVGVYLKQETLEKNEDSYDYNFELASEIEDEIGSEPMVDIRILNRAPYQFLNNVFTQGRLVLCRDEKLLSDLIEKSSRRYIANASFSQQALRELVNQ